MDQQPPNHQHPNQPPFYYGTPPQMGAWQPMPQKKKSRFPAILGGSCFALVIIFVILIAISASAGTAAVRSSTASPVQPTQNVSSSGGGKWTTTHTFTGNGTKKTDMFTVAGSNWKIEWSCDLAKSTFGPGYNVIVDVNNSDGTPNDPGAINTTCKKGNTSGSTTEYQGGDVYLDIQSEDNWKIVIQELK